MKPINKNKVINDPVYGFVNIPSDFIFDLISHPYFQRLRRIKQLGLSHLVYPGAMHTRFSHALGAMHLMQNAIENLINKGVDISKEEQESLVIAILLHDIGHGPFSHALEHSIISEVNHEEISALLMQRLNTQFGGKLNTAIALFNNDYPKKYLHQLVSSQLDIDRLDYLNRDTYFTGVSEGVVGWDRIIKMMNVHNGQLVVEEKGIYSIEKFLVSRRLMYWQVYLHKTAISAEILLAKILLRANDISRGGHSLFASPSLSYFLQNHIDHNTFTQDDTAIKHFINIDDFDILSAIKVWANDEDTVLSTLCKQLINRTLNKVTLSNTPFAQSEIERIKLETKTHFGIGDNDLDYFFDQSTVTNTVYNSEYDKIYILKNGKEMVDIADYSDLLNIEALLAPVTKYLLYHPKING